MVRGFKSFFNDTYAPFQSISSAGTTPIASANSAESETLVTIVDIFDSVIPDFLTNGIEVPVPKLEIRVKFISFNRIDIIIYN